MHVLATFVPPNQGLKLLWDSAQGAALGYHMLPRIMICGNARERQGPRWPANEVSIGVLFTVFPLALSSAMPTKTSARPGEANRVSSRLLPQILVLGSITAKVGLECAGDFRSGGTQV
jgi:hypothetical protein